MSKTGIRNMEKAAAKGLAADLLKIIAVGVVGGAATLAGAKALGEGLESAKEKQKVIDAKTAEKYKDAIEVATTKERLVEELNK